MTLESLARGNEIIKTLTKLEEQIEEYDLAISETEEDIEREETEERIYHNNKSFDCSTSDWLDFIRRLKVQACEEVDSLTAAFRKL